MKLWWLTDFVRLGAEKAAVECLAGDEGWFTLNTWRINKARLSAEGVIKVHGNDYPVRLIFPDQFPSVPAWVEPQDPEVKWSVHQYGKGGALCLELRPDNWTAEASGADVLRSAYNLLRTENPLGDGEHGKVASADWVGEVQSYDWGKEPVLIGAGCLERIRNGSAENVRALRWLSEDDTWPILVFDASDCKQPQHPPSSDLYSFRFEIPVMIARAKIPDPLPSDRVSLAAALNLEFGADVGNSALVVMAVDGELVTPVHSLNAESAFVRKLIVLPDDTGIRSGRASAARDKSVAVVGLGSVGSKVAEILLRSGISRLVLVDGDIFLPANLERHNLDWRDVGFRKVKAVKRRLLNIMPGATIETIANNLDWQRSAKTHSGQIDDIAQCDLIVDATGIPATTLMLGAITNENQKPFVSAQIFEGGLGSLIARVLPGRDPPYISGSAAYGAYCDQQNVKPPPSGRRSYETITEDGETLVADDAAATIAAAHAARIVLDILDAREELEDASWMLMGFRKGWLFTGHGHTIRLDVGRAPASTTTGKDVEAEAFAYALAKEALNATEITS